ncbi:hypothetical protein XIS1_1120049 [Xenorhabdus innexi]|uniref:Uncharacterized protein n=1 Tax=Xenorhabdus innexi TaxID=290109 RepID=A0A1N6MR87_9GAMM|nr:hypothetical protein XIS1_1120049 [Xenorhabdus innexi]
MINKNESLNVTLNLQTDNKNIKHFICIFVEHITIYLFYFFKKLSLIFIVSDI